MKKIWRFSHPGVGVGFRAKFFMNTLSIRLLIHLSMSEYRKVET